MSSGAKVVLFVLFLSLVAIIGGAVVLSNATQPKPIDSSTLIGDARHSLGSSDSAVTVVEFSDFQCPACRVSYTEIKRVVEKYQSQIRFIYRHFPISVSHPLAFEAAIASEIAGDQGKFWEMHDKLFEQQDEWTTSDVRRELFKQYAGDLGIDPESFIKEFENSKYKDRVNADMQDARTLGVNATPTLFAQGRRVRVDELDRVLGELVGK